MTVLQMIKVSSQERKWEALATTSMAQSATLSVSLRSTHAIYHSINITSCPNNIISTSTLIRRSNNSTSQETLQSRQCQASVAAVRTTIQTRVTQHRMGATTAPTITTITSSQTSNNLSALEVPVRGLFNSASIRLASHLTSLRLRIESYSSLSMITTHQTRRSQT